MGKDLAVMNKNNPLASFAEGVDPFSAFGNEAGGYSIFVKFNGNEGEWTFGKNHEEIDEDTLVVMNIMSLSRGWICWKDGQVMDEPMALILDGEKPLKEKDLEDYGPYDDKDDGWSEQASINMAFLQDGGNLELKLTSASGRRALMALSKEFGEKMRMHLDDNGDPMMPVCELGSESFLVKDKESKNKNKKFKKYAPIFTIVDWISFAEMTVLLNINEEQSEGDIVTKAITDASGSGDDEPKKKKKKKKKNKDKGEGRRSRY